MFFSLWCEQNSVNYAPQHNKNLELHRAVIQAQDVKITLPEGTFNGGYSPPADIHGCLSHMRGSSLEPAATKRALSSTLMTLDYVWYNGKNLYMN